MEVKILRRSMKAFVTGFVLMLLFTPYHGWSQVTSLDKILKAIRENNPMLKEYQFRSSAMKNYAQGATSLMAPEVGGGLWMVPYTKQTEAGNKGQIMLSVQQKFTSAAKLRANQHYLNSKAGIEDDSESYVFNELRAQAKTAYYQWMVTEEKSKVLHENEAIISLMLKLAKLRYPYNQSKLGNVFKAEGRLQEIKNMQLMNDTRIVQKNILLNQLMNQPTSNRFEVDTTTNVTITLLEQPDTITFVQDRSDIKRIDKTIQSMRLNQQLEKYQSRPDFNISFNHMIPRGSGMPSQFMLLGMVSIPIAPWSSKMYKSNVKGMESEIQSLKKEREAMLNEAVGMAASMANEISSLKQQLENYKTKIIPALKRNYQTLMLAYEENREELPIVIDGWEALNMAQMEYLNKLEEYYNMIVSYEKQLEK
ncbi:MAG: TolC family protein [Chryseolinea sp.]